MKRRRSLRCLFAAPLVAALLSGCPAEAAPPVPPLPECALPVTPETLNPGQAAIGFTVREGEQVEQFNVTILGVDRGALGPGKDLIVVNTKGPVIDEGGGGISAGMSGSPVYTEDGKLVGAIAYGFSVGPSWIGGVTPAPDMLRVFAEGAAAAAEQGSAAARLAPGTALRCGTGRRAVLGGGGDGSPQGAGLGVRKPPPRATQRATRRPDGGRCPRDRQPRCERHRPLGTAYGETRARRRDRRRAVLWGPHRCGDRDDDLRLRRQGGGLWT